MFDSYLAGGCLDASQKLLAQAILSLEEAHSTQQSLTKSPPTRKSLSHDVAAMSRNIKLALDRLSKLYILLFGPQCSEDSYSFGHWITQNRRLLNGFLGDDSKVNVDKIFDIVLGDDAALGAEVGELLGSPKIDASPPQRCEALMAYVPVLGLQGELKTFRRIAQKRFKWGIPRDVVDQVAALEKLFHLARDPTTDCIWNTTAEHQELRNETFESSDMGKHFRQKCICMAANESSLKAHKDDPYCPKNPKAEDKVTLSDEDKKAAEKKLKEEKEAEEKKAKKEAEEKKKAEKIDPSGKITSKRLMAEILDMIGPQHVKDHFHKIKGIVSSSFREENPWESKQFSMVLMGPASTGKEKIAKKYAKYLASCGINKELIIEREASYIIENDKLEEYFKRLAEGGILSIENSHLLVSYKHKDKLMLNYLLEETEKSKGKVTIILHGEEQQLREFLARTSHAKLFPHILALNEFKGEDALTILKSGMENWFGEKTEVEGGWDGLYMRIAARRLAKKEGNVTEHVESLVQDIYTRQRKRISESRKAKEQTGKTGPLSNAESTKESNTEPVSTVSVKDETQVGVEQNSAKTPEPTSSANSDLESQPKSQSRTSTILSLQPVPATPNSVAVDKRNPEDETCPVSVEGSTDEIMPYEIAEPTEGLISPVDIMSERPTPAVEFEVPTLNVASVESSSDNFKPEKKTVTADLSLEKSKSEEEDAAAATSTPESAKEALKGEIEPQGINAATAANLPGTETSNPEDTISEAPKEKADEESKGPIIDSTNIVDEAKVTKDVDESKADLVADKSAGADDASDSGNESDSSSKTDSTTITIPETSNEEAEREDIVDPEDYTFTRDDIIGPTPTNKVLESEAWKKLDKLIGLKKVKESLLNFLELAKASYQRELQEKPPFDLTFNRLFLGPPGTGKTVVAKLYGQILAEIGVLSKGELVVKTASDLVGKYIGDSETNTNEALKEAAGSVLVIDEAYMLYTSDGVSNTTDCFRQGIIDTLVGKVQNTPGEDRCVLLLGYEDQMRSFLTESNPGLIRRFPLEDAFLFEEFSTSELEGILRLKLEEYGLDATEEAIKVAVGVLDKARSRMNFGNGGAVENLVTKAKLSCLQRISAIPEGNRPEDWVLGPSDFDPEHDRGATASSNLKKLFSDVIGCEDIIKKLENYQTVCQALKSRDMDPREFIPTNFVFKGPPGTGKTTTARKIAQVYYDMGFLSEASVVECSVSDLIGRYIGHTGPKTVKALERGLGKVLFIDEAYRLNQGSYASEAVSELVDQLTKPKFLGKIIVILAGYVDEMNTLMTMNPGLASRFPEEIVFELLPAKGCLDVLHMKLKQSGIKMPLMESEDKSNREALERLLRSLAQTQFWGNARDVETLAKSVTRKVLLKGGLGGDLICDVKVATEAMEEMLSERRSRDGLANVPGMYY